MTPKQVNPTPFKVQNESSTSPNHRITELKRSVRLAGGFTCMGNSCSPGCRWWCLWWRLAVLSFFPLDVLDEIWDVIESVSEGFLTYFCKVAGSCL